MGSVLSVVNFQFCESINFDDLVKSHIEAARWLSKKFDIQGVVFLTGTRLYMWYVESLSKTYNAVDRTFYDAIMIPVVTCR